MDTFAQLIIQVIKRYLNDHNIPIKYAPPLYSCLQYTTIHEILTLTLHQQTQAHITVNKTIPWPNRLSRPSKKIALHAATIIDLNHPNSLQEILKFITARRNQ